MMHSKSQVEDIIVQQKVDASKYFLTKMKEAEWGDPAFRYNLEAFLAILLSARTILYDSNKGWFSLQKIYSDPLAVYFLELRNVTVHSRSPDPKQIVRSTLTIPFGYSIEGEIPRPELKVPAPTKSSESFYLFETLDNEIKDGSKVKQIL